MGHSISDRYNIADHRYNKRHRDDDQESVYVVHFKSDSEQGNDIEENWTHVQEDGREEHTESGSRNCEAQRRELKHLNDLAV